MLSSSSIFQSLDPGGTGFLDARALEEHLRTSHPALSTRDRTAAVESLMRSMCAGADGRVSLSNFKRAIDEHLGEHKEPEVVVEVDTILARIDAQQTGRVDALALANFLTIAGYPTVDARQLLRDLDQDRKGHITDAEFRHAAQHGSLAQFMQGLAQSPRSLSPASSLLSYDPSSDSSAFGSVSGQLAQDSPPRRATGPAASIQIEGENYGVQEFFNMQKTASVPVSALKFFLENQRASVGNAALVEDFVPALARHEAQSRHISRAEFEDLVDSCTQFGDGAAVVTRSRIEALKRQIDTSHAETASLTLILEKKERQFREHVESLHASSVDDFESVDKSAAHLKAEVKRLRLALAATSRDPNPATAAGSSTTTTTTTLRVLSDQVVGHRAATAREVLDGQLQAEIDRLHAAAEAAQAAAARAAADWHAQVAKIRTELDGAQSDKHALQQMLTRLPELETQVAHFTQGIAELTAAKRALEDQLRADSHTSGERLSQALATQKTQAALCDRQAAQLLVAETELLTAREAGRVSQRVAADAVARASASASAATHRMQDVARAQQLQGDVDSLCEKLERFKAGQVHDARLIAALENEVAAALHESRRANHAFQSAMASTEAEAETWQQRWREASRKEQQLSLILEAKNAAMDGWEVANKASLRRQAEEILALKSHCVAITGQVCDEKNRVTALQLQLSAAARDRINSEGMLDAVQRDLANRVQAQLTLEARLKATQGALQRAMDNLQTAKDSVVAAPAPGPTAAQMSAKLLLNKALVGPKPSVLVRRSHRCVTVTSDAVQPPITWEPENAPHVSPVPEQLFPIARVWPSDLATALGLGGPVIVGVSSSCVTLYTKNNCLQIASWPIAHISRFGSEGNVFSLEMGPLADQRGVLYLASRAASHAFRHLTRCTSARKSRVHVLETDRRQSGMAD